MSIKLVIPIFKISLCSLALILVQCSSGSEKSTSLPVTTAAEVEEIVEEESVPAPKDSERTSWQKPELIIQQMGNISEKTIADIGAGTGYFSFQLMHKAKKVIAIDIDENMIALLDAFMGSLSEKMSKKIETRLALPNDPLLKKDEADIALFVNVVPYMEARVDYFTNLKQNLTEEGMVMIVDFKTRRLPIDAPSYEQRVLPHIVEEELYNAGFSRVYIDDSTLDYQYIITAK
jgi:SAM-dependent methyltransferase